MLLQLRVQNYKSIKGEATLSLVAAKTPEIEGGTSGIPHDEAHLLRVSGATAALRCAAVFGGNASGKSNLLRALTLVRDLVVHGTCAGERLPALPFALDGESRRSPTIVEVDFVAGSRQWSYRFDVDEQRVRHEHLYVERDGLVADAYDRYTTSQGVRVAVSGLTAERRGFLEHVAEGTRPNQLFLAECANRNVHELADVVGWFRRIRSQPRDSEVARRLDCEPALRAFAGEFLRRCDLGLREVVPQALTLAFRPEAGEILLDADEVPSSVFEVLALATLIYDVRRDADPERPQVAVLDDFGRGLHPNLARALLGELLRAGSAERPFQVVLATHCADLLDARQPDDCSTPLLPRDSVWFTERNRDGSTSLASLAEFDVSRLESGPRWERSGYLQGRFGGVPYVGELSSPQRDAEVK